MAYKSEAVCDSCGDYVITFLNQTVSITKMRKIAQSQGWNVRQRWICPECRKKIEVVLKETLNEVRRV